MRRWMHGLPFVLAPGYRAHGPKAPRILVVDDNTDAAHSFSVLLEHQGHQVETAHDGAEAIVKARNLRPQIVFLDLGMPRMGGLEAAKRLRSLAKGEPMLLVTLTGWGQKQDQQRTREAGFDVHLLKPINPADLDKVLAASSASIRAHSTIGHLCDPGA